MHAAVPQPGPVDNASLLPADYPVVFIDDV
jgi:hypothetical protein